ncbi:MAG: CoA activase, partial [Halobacteriovoraceae bacterium]|nr:CoA activase [Halobacteriovoraceae bacterium]
ASGTGATIDKCMLKVGVAESEIPQITFDPQKLHHVAAKCGVFAETDIVNLIKSGIPAAEILNSLADAIVNQNLSVLTKGYTLKPKVILLGGPNHYLPFLKECWRYRLRELWIARGYEQYVKEDIEKTVIVPDNALYFAALGCAFWGINRKKNYLTYKGLAELTYYIGEGRKKVLADISVKGLSSSETELEQFKEKYQLKPFVHYEPQFPGEVIEGYLGFDGGSTSSKCVVIDTAGKILFKEYTLSKGNPFDDFKYLLSEMDKKLEKIKSKIEILGFGVTGYAANVFEKVYKADVNVIETIAHMKSSQNYFGEIDVICDIGGQDIKVLFFNNNELSHFKLSNQCSAGNGMILQGMAEQFGHKVEEYSDEAFKAQIAPVFSYGCAVFLDSDRVNFQKKGFSKNEIMAGMAQVLPKNIWQYVVQVPRLEQFGTRFVLQGGTQYNLAALKAQVDYIEDRVRGAKVNLHPHPGEAGAIGAALEAREVVTLKGFSTFIGLENSKNLLFSTRSDETTRCDFCPNLCSRAFIDAKISELESVRYISGFSCDKGTVENKEALRKLLKEKKKYIDQFPNLVRLEAKELFKKRDCPTTINRTDKIITMPKVLNMWVMAPFFNAYFQFLGVADENICWSTETNEQMGKEGMKYGAIDPCFPAKIAQAHIHQILFKKKTDIVYFPAITHIPTFLKGIMGETTCPVVQGTPLVIKASFTAEKDIFSEKKVHYINDALDFSDISYLKKQLLSTWKKVLGISKKENSQAIEYALDSLNNYDHFIESKGREILENVESEGEIAILLMGRPYHLDHGINHQILDEIQSLGFPIITMRSIPKDKEFLKKNFLKTEDELSIEDVWPENFSTNSAQKVWAAKFAARHPNVHIIDISSFKCGHDSPTYGLIEKIVSVADTSYLTLHDLDQTSPTESFKIRLKTFAYNLNKKKLKLKQEGNNLCQQGTQFIGQMQIQEGLVLQTEKV